MQAQLRRKKPAVVATSLRLNGANGLYQAFSRPVLNYSTDRTSLSLHLRRIYRRSRSRRDLPVRTASSNLRINPKLCSRDPYLEHV